MFGVTILEYIQPEPDRCDCGLLVGIDKKRAGLCFVLLLSLINLVNLYCVDKIAVFLLL